MANRGGGNVTNCHRCASATSRLAQMAHGCYIYNICSLLSNPNTNWSLMYIKFEF